MPGNRTETRWFFGVICFLLVYSVFLYTFRSILIKVEMNYQVDIFKPEPIQVFVMDLLILLYHFGFVGLYYFSRGSQWKKVTAALIGVFLTGNILYGFNQWYDLTSHPFLQLPGTMNLPWYAGDKTKFLLVNSPIILYFLIVFVLRVFMIFKEERSPVN